jgi:glyoxylase I family protein
MPADRSNLSTDSATGGRTLVSLRPKLHHIALTVTDLDASAEWYQNVFRISFVADIPHEGGLGRVLSDQADELGIVLHRHDANDGESFKETRTGLDHVGLALSSRSDLEEWQKHLEEQGVVRADAADRPLTQSPIADDWYGSVLVFRDPDNIQLELYAPPEGGDVAP